mmetsp:Transcript_17527/g.39663  ORF Transcript_17527/g.39663 Transcript_17527/m.39663 type:complete len:85 (-) Transcript_17527:315-569(-)
MKSAPLCCLQAAASEFPGFLHIALLTQFLNEQVLFDFKSDSCAARCSEQCRRTPVPGTPSQAVMQFPCLNFDMFFTVYLGTQPI